MGLLNMLRARYLLLFPVCIFSQRERVARLCGVVTASLSARMLLPRKKAFLCALRFSKRNHLTISAGVKPFGRAACIIYTFRLTLFILSYRNST